MPRTVAPLWLSRPSRFAGLERGKALGVAALLIILVAACVMSLSLQPAGDAAGLTTPAAESDVYFYGSIVDGIRAGGDYYSVAASALRAANLPLKPFLAFPMPTLAVVEAALPNWGVQALLYLLAILTAWAWYLRLQQGLPRPAPRFAAMLLLAGGMIACVQPETAPVHEPWAALLVALSLALRKPGRWVDAAAVGLAAMLVRETAALYGIVMMIIALVEGRRREGLGWLLTLVVFAAVLAVHAMAVARATGPLDPASPQWIGLGGFGLFTSALTASTALQALPLWIAGPAIALALFGWASWDDALAARGFTVLVAYALFISIVASPSALYWGLLVAPILLLGIAFAPDGVRDVVRAILDRRRVTVQRIVR